MYEPQGKPFTMLRCIYSRGATCGCLLGWIQEQLRSNVISIKIGIFCG